MHEIGAINSFASVNKIRFTSPLVGFAIGNGGLCLKTTDKGVTWKKIETPTSGEYYDIYFQNAKQGFIVGSYSPAIIIKTDDGGDSWQPDFNYYNRAAGFTCIAADAGKRKIIVAGGGNGRSILCTTDSGTHYSNISANIRMNYYTTHFLNDSTGYIAGEDGVSLKTSDYGETWKDLKYVPFDNGSGALQKLSFFDPMNGYAANNSVYMTADGGESWQPIPSAENPALSTLFDVHFFDRQRGLAQYPSYMYRTVNGGNDWTKVLTSEYFSTFAAAPGGNVVAIETGGRIYVSHNEGETWTINQITTTDFLVSAYYYNNDIGFIGSSDTAIFKTTDGGSTWTPINTGFAYNRKTAFKFVSESVGYMIGDNLGGTCWVYKTLDGGLTWQVLTTIGETLSGFGGDKMVYIIGNNGLILKLDSLMKPPMPGYIYGLDRGCLNNTSTFTTGPTYGLDYHWTLASGGTHSPNTFQDTVFWNTEGIHTLSLAVSNACGVSESRTVAIEVKEFLPTITVQDTFLIATEGESYQWYIDGSAIDAAHGGKAKNFVPKYSGSYTADVKSSYGCTIRTAEVKVQVPIVVSLCPGGGAFLYSSLGNTYQWQVDDGSGFINISDNDSYAGTITSVLKIIAAPSAWYGYKFRCVTNFGISNVYILNFVDNWNGSVSDAWENPANWSCGKVPDANTDVYISFSAVTINSNVIVRKLVLSPSSFLTVKPGNTLTIKH